MNELETLVRLQALAVMRRETLGTGSYDDRVRMEEEISARRSQLPRPLITRYDKLAEEYSDPVVVLVNGTCPGCAHRVPPGERKRAAQEKHALPCKGCGRLLIS